MKVCPEEMLPFLSLLNHPLVIKRRTLLHHLLGDEQVVRVVASTSKNLLRSDQIQLSDSEKTFLSQYRSILLKIADPSIPVAYKRKLLRRHLHKFLPQILKPCIELLTNGE